MTEEKPKKPKARVINDWRIDRLFDVDVLVGQVDGCYVTRHLLWRSHDRFGTGPGRWQDGENEVFKEGIPAADPYPTLQALRYLTPSERASMEYATLEAHAEFDALLAHKPPKFRFR